MATMTVAFGFTTRFYNAISIPSPSIHTKFLRLEFPSTISLRLRRQRRMINVVSNSVETDAGASTSNIPKTSTEAVESDSSSSMSAPRSFCSLITASNIRKALDGIKVVSVDHYAQLGIPRGCSFDEVRDAFKRKCEDLMQQELDEQKAQSKLQDLKESYEILSSEEERRFYDWSLARSENQDRYIWPYEVDITQKSSAPGPTKEEDDPTLTTYVGYFFIGWLLLAFALNFTLK